MNNLPLRQIKQQIAQSELILLNKKAEMGQQYHHIRKKIISTRSFVTAFGIGFAAGLVLLPKHRGDKQNSKVTTSSKPSHHNFSQKLIQFASALSTIFSIKQMIVSLLSSHNKAEHTEIK